MGTTLHAIVEVFYPKSEYANAAWDEVATFDFGKDYPVMIALNEANPPSWPVPYSNWKEHGVFSRTARSIVERGIDENRQMFTPARLREAALALALSINAEPEPGDEDEPDERDDAASLRFAALLATVDALALGYNAALPAHARGVAGDGFGGDCVRVLFWRI